MALTQSMLKALGIDDEDKRKQILDEHTSVLTEIREERDRYKEEASKVEGLQKRLREAEEADEGDRWKAKYEEERKAFSEYREGVESERTRAEVSKAYREQVLSKAGIDPKRVDSVMRVTDLDGIELEDGKVKGADDLVKRVRDEWSDFVVRTRTEKPDVPSPDGADGGGSGPSEIAKQVIRERQARLYGNVSNDEGGNK